MIIDVMSSAWHPIFNTTETTPGRWEMQQSGDYGPFGTIELRRVNAGSLRYKVMLGSELIGWASTLQVACEALWVAHLEQQRNRREGIPNRWSATTPARTTPPR